MLLVRNRDSKVDLERRLEEKGWAGTVLTILEAKGLEYDDVVLVNVFSSTSLASRIRILYSFVSTERREPGMRLPVFDYRKHSELCQLLKELYVRHLQWFCFQNERIFFLNFL